MRVAEGDSLNSDEQRPGRRTPRELFEVVGVTNASSSIVASTLVSFFRSVAMLVTGGLVEGGPKSKVRVVDRRNGQVLVDYDYGHDLEGALEHVRQLNERLDVQTPEEFV